MSRGSGYFEFRSRLVRESHDCRRPSVGEIRQATIGDLTLGRLFFWVGYEIPRKTSLTYFHQIGTRSRISSQNI
jgi:hypothetical protein